MSHSRQEAEGVFQEGRSSGVDGANVTSDDNLSSFDANSGTEC